MAKTYVEVTQDQMEAVLAPLGFRRMKLEGTREVVYGKRVGFREGGLKDGKAKDRPLTIRVYSSITGGTSRDCGEDAIRICLVAWKSGSGPRIIGTQTRVNRVDGWNRRLKERIEDWKDLVGPPCPKCQGVMVTRKGGKGKFWGCLNYPDCHGTQNLKK